MARHLCGAQPLAATPSPRATTVTYGYVLFHSHTFCYDVAATPSPRASFIWSTPYPRAGCSLSMPPSPPSGVCGSTHTFPRQTASLSIARRCTAARCGRCAYCRGAAYAAVPLYRVAIHLRIALDRCHPSLSLSFSLIVTGALRGPLPARAAQGWHRPGVRQALRRHGEDAACRLAGRGRQELFGLRVLLVGSSPGASALARDNPF